MSASEIIAAKHVNFWKDVHEKSFSPTTSPHILFLSMKIFDSLTVYVQATSFRLSTRQSSFMQVKRIRTGSSRNTTEAHVITIQFKHVNEVQRRGWATKSEQNPGEWN